MLPRKSKPILLGIGGIAYGLISSQLVALFLTETSVIVPWGDYVAYFFVMIPTAWILLTAWEMHQKSHKSEQSDFKSRQNKSSDATKRGHRRD